MIHGLLSPPLWSAYYTNRGSDLWSEPISLPEPYQLRWRRSDSSFPLSLSSCSASCNHAICLGKFPIDIAQGGFNNIQYPRAAGLSLVILTQCYPWMNARGARPSL
uniref:Uncharacterized protein n=1 Tax=Utricularia reniformis TaxID=192314 RepID=A0A1Y0B038_9LAMI|nr:hypothetical protein AEK19_MT0473 [Utricularia reniformis]ART30731.1 hypothetical protein AEK19_MT0473 [Utricularia reniformis]